MSEDNSDNGSSGQDSDWESWSGDEGRTSQSLFETRAFPSAEAAMDFDHSNYQFDLRQLCREDRLDQLAMIKCINYIRRSVQCGTQPSEVVATLRQGTNDILKTDDNLLPVLEEDGLLLFDFDSLEAEDGPGVSVAQSRHGEAPDELLKLQKENEALKSMLVQLRQATFPDQELAASTSDARKTSPPPSPEHNTAPSRKFRPTQTAAARRIDQSYFDSYSHMGIHREMLADRSRTEGYASAITACVKANPGSVVLDVGCGTGILGMLAARAGARQVIGVEGSPAMASMAEAICHANGLSASNGGPISIVPGLVEQVAELPVQQVDVLVSEWMGYALLFESMLGSVIYARDRWLRPGGVMLPDTASLFVAGAAANKDDLAFWDTVDFDLGTMRPEDADFSVSFHLQAATEHPRQCSAVVVWFDVAFGSHKGSSWHSKLSTSPCEKQTHWAQALLTLRTPIALQKQQSAMEAGNQDVLAYDLAAE
ncbi:hypothetical protein WJX73_003246 [Symbiochloris irregularis]|uniref:Uncharacterized protein n=1 Tax=Symbiochloris irregularis TaxID=706552 RepID=A0AAW1NYZ0_9CHLO